MLQFLSKIAVVDESEITAGCSSDKLQVAWAMPKPKNPDVDTRWAGTQHVRGVRHAGKLGSDIDRVRDQQRR